MDNIRLGYACINTQLPSPNRSCIQKTFVEKGATHAIALAKINLESVINIIEWNEKNGIQLYRMSSDMFPHITNPKFINNDKFAYDLNQFDDYFRRIGELAKKYNHRLTFHPGQFNQVGAINLAVFEKTKIELDYHAQILDKCGLDLNSILIVHGGGVYGDKETTKTRWVKQFFELPNNVRDRLVIENCERQYSYIDVIDIAKQIKRPIVFDTHHYDCYSLIHNTEQKHPKKFLKKMIKSWTYFGLVPKFHVSEQAINKRIGAHSDFVEDIPEYLLECNQIDIMIEAKKKEQATLKLMKKYFIV